jgi:hypothetical protein
MYGTPFPCMKHSQPPTPSHTKFSRLLPSSFRNKAGRMTNTYIQSSLHFIHFIKKTKQFLKDFLTTVTMHAVDLDVVTALKGMVNTITV